MGELADQALGGIRQSYPLQHLIDGASGFLAGMNPARRQPDVLAHRKTIENARHLGMGRLQLSGQHLEEGALAGAVGADQAAQLPFGQREIDVAHRANAAEMHAEILGLKQRRGHQPSSARLGCSVVLARMPSEVSSHWPRSPSVGISPFGTSNTNAIRMTPKINGALAKILAHQSEPLLCWLAPSAVVSH